MKSKKIKYIKSSRLQEYRKKWWEEQKGICPILQQEIPFEKSSVDHIHKRKADEVGGSNNLGLIRGVIHFQANSLEGKITNAYKRYGIDKYIDLPSFLRNLADYIENPPLVHLKLVHPNEAPKRKKLSKKEFNKLKKYYFKIYPNKTKLPVWPKSGIVTKQLEEDLKKLRKLNV